MPFVSVIARNAFYARVYAYACTRMCVCACGLPFVSFAVRILSNYFGLLPVVSLYLLFFLSVTYVGRIFIR